MVPNGPNKKTGHDLSHDQKRLHPGFQQQSLQARPVAAGRLEAATCLLTRRLKLR